MNRGTEERLKIVELSKEDLSSINLSSTYFTSGYYDLIVEQGKNGWKAMLTLNMYDRPLEKKYTGTFFEKHVNESRVFAAVLDENQIGWIELGYESWNNRMRIWEFLVTEKFRRMGVGSLLMNHGLKIAREKGARMLVLETQSCNVPAIDFYMKQGFSLIGFDNAAYSNMDVEKKEIRLEFGKKLQQLDPV